MTSATRYGPTDNGYISVLSRGGILNAEKAGILEPYPRLSDELPESVIQSQVFLDREFPSQESAPTLSARWNPMAAPGTTNWKSAWQSS